MYSFLNDYSEGAHPLVLEALTKTNDIQTVGYGLDEYCQKAKDVILERIATEADIHFLVGGTQTNAIVIKSILKGYQAVMACDEGHINVHETGAIEATGHKILTRPHQDGKLTVEAIESMLLEHCDEHMVQPKMVYISQTTELGTYYTKNELKELYTYCQKHDLYLFIDGARLASSLSLKDAPSMQELAKYSDVFYIGGTKSGALFGEAVVITNDQLKNGFRYYMKQSGALLAKGRLLGVQFYTLLKDRLYEEIGEHENAMAMIIKEAFVNKGYPLYVDSYSNQLFIDLPKTMIEAIEKHYMITHVKPVDQQHERIRIVTSFKTPKEAALEFANFIGTL